MHYHTNTRVNIYDDTTKFEIIYPAVCGFFIPVKRITQPTKNETGQEK
jgi:hypothetical protein